MIPVGRSREMRQRCRVEFLDSLSRECKSCSMWNVLGGLALGLLGGVIAWALAQVVLRPRVRCSLQISKSRSPSFASGFRYHAKIKNASFFRAIADLRIQGRVYFRHSYQGGSTGRSLRLGTSPADLAFLPPRGHVLVSIDPAALDAVSVERLRDWGYGVADRSDRSLEDLMSLPRAYFSVQIQGNDGWSGRAYFKETPRLRLADGVVVDAGFVMRQTRLDKFVLRLERRRREASTTLLRRRLVLRSNPELATKVNDPQSKQSSDVRDDGPH